MVPREPLSLSTTLPPTVAGEIWSAAASALNMFVPPLMDTSGPLTPSAGVLALKARVFARMSLALPECSTVSAPCSGYERKARYSWTVTGKPYASSALAR